MEEKGYIEIRVENIDNSYSPNEVDISDIRNLISDIENFIYPTKEDKKSRPHISYDIQPGSAKHLFNLPISAVIMFNGLTQEINRRNSIDFLDYKRQEIISKFQKIASTKGLTFEFNSSMQQNSNLIISSLTDFVMTAPKFIESEFYLYGEIYQEGGKTPNINITSPEYGNLTIAATKEQIKEGDKKTYKMYGVKVRGKKSLEDGKLSDLKLVEFITYEPTFNRSLLDKMIQKASLNLSKIKDVDKWINDLKTDGI
ncbi:hypothetical protein MG290_01945 [Flavobacterium sp. CBA20B-1]|uniref:hypothetical protein n=1 Tax=unclassified Flavobacterium TaxID=196869 RepID=UPI002225260D|nr:MULTISPECIES: hypothetical protein [unclassified Flavobacterium]WCM42457.1 hypothetical protein MG290_01945 [Flavobacterium sp. CBA20B-1]